MFQKEHGALLFANAAMQVRMAYTVSTTIMR